MCIVREQPSGGESKRSRHTEVHEESATGFKPHDQVLAATLDTRHELADELVCNEIRVERPRQPRVGDGGTRDVRPFQRGRDRSAHGLDFR